MDKGKTIMKKLTELLKESYVWERKFGEKLPTLADVQKKKNEGRLTEKKKLDQRFLDDIHKMTQRNNHTLARFQLTKYMGNDKLSLFYSSMENLNKVFGGYGPELSKLNQKMEKELYKAIKKSYANAEEIIGLL